MIERLDDAVQMVPIAQIAVVNARTRGRAKFRQIVANIERPGLKKPITVARRNGQGDAPPHYDLVYGQGRLEAYAALGQELVPAIVIDASREDLFVMSLVENLARRRYRSADLAREVRALKERGYDHAEIARKTNLEVSYVKGVLRLLDTGEERLIRAVDAGQIPISMSILIASADDQAIQKALTDAYNNTVLRGKALQRAKQLIEARRRGRGRGGKGRKAGGEVTVANLMKVYEAETARQGELVRSAKRCDDRLVFIVSAVRTLLQDAGFVALLRAESFDTMPEYLGQRVRGRRE